MIDQSYLLVGKEVVQANARSGGVAQATETVAEDIQP